jgi:hypothetical protein
LVSIGPQPIFRGFDPCAGKLGKLFLETIRTHFDMSFGGHVRYPIDNFGVVSNSSAKQCCSTRAA